MELKIKWQETQTLEELINTCYFTNNNGVLRIGQEILVEDPINIKILHGLDCSVKLKSNIIDGVLKGLKKEVDNKVYLKPINTYCIKSEENKKYSFY